MIDIVNGVISKEKSISENMLLAYEALLQNNIVTRKEVSLLEAWLHDLDELQVNTIKKQNEDIYIPQKVS